MRLAVVALAAAAAAASAALRGAESAGAALEGGAEVDAGAPVIVQLPGGGQVRWRFTGGKARVAYAAPTHLFTTEHDVKGAQWYETVRRSPNFVKPNKAGLLAYELHTGTSAQQYEVVYLDAAAYDALAKGYCTAFAGRLCGDAASLRNLVVRLWTQEKVNHAAGCTGEPTDSGSMVLRDDGTNFFKLFRAHPRVYARVSSHRIPRPNNGQADPGLGLDFDTDPFPVTNCRGPGLPNTTPMTYTTMLFGSYSVGNRDYLFVKMEPHGTAGLVDTVKHMKEFFKPSLVEYCTRKEGGTKGRFAQARLPLYKKRLAGLEIQPSVYKFYVHRTIAAQATEGTRKVLANAVAHDILGDTYDALKGELKAKVANWRIAHEDDFAGRLGHEMFFTAAEVVAAADAVGAGDALTTLRPTCALCATTSCRAVPFIEAPARPLLPAPLTPPTGGQPLPPPTGGQPD